MDTMSTRTFQDHHSARGLACFPWQYTRVCLMKLNAARPVSKPTRSLCFHGTAGKGAGEICVFLGCCGTWLKPHQLFVSSQPADQS